MPVKENQTQEIIIKERKRVPLIQETPEEDRMPEILEKIKMAMHINILSLDGLKLKHKEFVIIKEKYPQVEYEHGTLILRRQHYILPRRQKSGLVIEEGKDRNLLEEWKKANELRPRKSKPKEWLVWLFDYITPRLIELLQKDEEALLYSKDELAHLIHFIRCDIIDEKEFNYIIRRLLEDNILKSKKIHFAEYEYSEIYYGITKKGKEQKNNEPLNTPVTQ